MKFVPSLPLLCAGALIAFAIPSRADTVTLKSGEKLSGTILSETDKEIVMDVTVASGITDQKTISKAEVKSAVKTPPDELAYQNLKEAQIEPHSLPLASYAANIKTLENFLKQYPQSSRANEVKARKESFAKEQVRVKAGDLKWNNRWYTQREVEKNKYQLSAQIALGTMKEQASRRDFIGALNTFDRIETTYPGSTAFPDAIDLAMNMIQVATADVDRIQTNAKTQETQYNNGILLVPEPQKSQIIATRNAQIAAADAAVTAADRAGVKWKPLLPLSSKSFENIKATLISEGPRIEKLPVATMRDSITAAIRAQEELDAKNVENAEAKIKEAEKLWQKNEQLISLKASLVALKESLKPKLTPTPKATPTPTPSATPTPVPSESPSPAKKKSKGIL